MFRDSQSYVRQWTFRIKVRICRTLHTSMILRLPCFSGPPQLSASRAGPLRTSPGPFGVERTQPMGRSRRPPQAAFSVRGGFARADFHSECQRHARRGATGREAAGRDAARAAATIRPNRSGRLGGALDLSPVRLHARKPSSFYPPDGRGPLPRVRATPPGVGGHPADACGVHPTRPPRRTQALWVNPRERYRPSPAFAGADFTGAAFAECLGRRMRGRDSPPSAKLQVASMQSGGIRS